VCANGISLVHNIVRGNLSSRPAFKGDFYEFVNVFKTGTKESRGNED